MIQTLDNGVGFRVTDDTIHISIFLVRSKLNYTLIPLKKMKYDVTHSVKTIRSVEQISQDLY